MITQADTEGQETGKIKQILFWFLVLFIPLLAGFVVIAPRILPPANAQDFIQFWVAGKMNWLGLNPYDTEAWVAQRLFHGNGWLPDLVFNYPLPLYRFLAPLGLLPITPAYYLWGILTLAYLSFIFSLIYNHFGVPRLGSYIIPAAAGAIIFRPVLVTLRNGQISGLIFLLVSLGAFLVVERKNFVGGVVLGLCMLKPQIGFGIILFISIWALLNKNWKFLGGIAACELGLLVVGMLTDPNWVRTFLIESADKIEGYSGYSPTIWGMTSYLAGGSETSAQLFAWFITLGLTGFLLWVVIIYRSRMSAFTVVSLVIPVVLLVTPYVWPYDHFILLLPWLVLSASMVERGFSYLKVAVITPLGSLFAVVLLLLALEMGHDSISMLVPLVTFIWAVGIFILPIKNNSLIYDPGMEV